MLKTMLIFIGASALLASGPALAPRTNNANPNAPGQDRTCLVTTGVPNSWNDVDVTGAKWLPRKAAEAQAKKDPSTMRTFEYENDSLVTGGTCLKVDAAHHRPVATFQSQGQRSHSRSDTRSPERMEFIGLGGVEILEASALHVADATAQLTKSK
ncbi:MAG: hypothetical protein ACTHLT_18910 [Devosia sp.]